MGKLSVHFDVPYKHELMLDLLLPAAAEIAPCVVWLYGGAWLEGSRKTRYDDINMILAEAGIAVCACDYTLSQKAVYPRQIEDVLDCVSWLSAHSAELGIDPERIFLWGHSAGGHLALSAMLHSVSYSGPKISGVCAFAPPTNLVALSGFANRLHYESARGPIGRLIGGQPGDNMLTRAASPVFCIPEGSAVPPVLLVHGENDDLVPISQSVELLCALNDRGNSCRLVRLPGQRHIYTQECLVLCGQLLKDFVLGKL